MFFFFFQIKYMMVFIEQEVNEKVEEIDVKVGNCNLCYQLCYYLLYSGGFVLLYKYIIYLIDFSCLIKYIKKIIIFYKRE